MKDYIDVMKKGRKLFTLCKDCYIEILEYFDISEK